MIHAFLRLPRSIQVPILIAVALSVGGIIYYFATSGLVKERPFPTVEIAKVRKAALSEQATVIGTLEANQLVVLRAQVSGTIEEIHFEGGKTVEKDAPLITLDDKIYKANMLDAEAQLKTAKADFDRVKKLAKNNAFASQKTKEQAEAKFHQADAKYQVSKHQLESTVIRAPFSGTVGLRQEVISVGTLVDQRQELLRIVDVDPIRIRFAVPARIAAKLHTDQNVEFAIDGQEKNKIKAKIESIDAQVSKATNSLSMYATAPNPHGVLRPGLFGRVFLSAGTREGVIVVPEVAVDLAGDEKFIYRVVPLVTNGKKRYLAEKVTVVTGIRSGSDIEIISGLRPDDHIIVVGNMKFAGLPRAYASVINEEDFPELVKQTIDVDAINRKREAQANAPHNEDKKATSEAKEKTDKADTPSRTHDEDDEDEDDDEDEEDDSAPQPVSDAKKIAQKDEGNAQKEPPSDEKKSKKSAPKSQTKPNSMPESGKRVGDQSKDKAITV